MSDSSRLPRSLWLTIIRQSGVLLLTAGIALALLAPLEMHVFSYFSEGGRFAYPGFGYGSFMFANLAAQIMGYAALAAMLIPLGYGHLLARRWIAMLGEALLQVWVVAGLPFVLALLAVLFASKEVSLPAGIAVTAFLASAYPALPWLGRRFYRGAGVRAALVTDPAPPCWIDTIPHSALALAILYGLLILAHLVMIMLRGLFPVFGTWITGVPGVIGLDLSIALLIVVIWGTLRQARWARWAGLVAVVAGTASWITSLATSSWSALLTVLALPPYEVEFLDGVPLQGWIWRSLSRCRRPCWCGTSFGRGDRDKAHTRRQSPPETRPGPCSVRCSMSETCSVAIRYTPYASEVTHES